MHRMLSGYHHYCLKITKFLLDITLLMFAELQTHWDFHLCPLDFASLPSSSHHSRRYKQETDCVSAYHPPSSVWPQAPPPSIPTRGSSGSRKGEERRKEWKREVRLCPTGLVSVCVNQEVRMWQQERHDRDIPSLRPCACVCVCALLDWGVIHVKITASS